MSTPVHTYTHIHAPQATADPPREAGHTAGEVRDLVNDLVFAWAELPLDLFWWIDALRRMPDDAPVSADVVAHAQAMHAKYRGAVVQAPESEDL